MISVIIPVVRPENIEKLVQQVHDNSGLQPCEIEVLWEEDVDSIGCPEMVKRLVARTQYELVCFIGDDTSPQPGFLVEAIAAMQTLTDQADVIDSRAWGLVGLNDKSGRRNPTHWIAHKKLLEFTGGDFFSTAYTHNFCDNELWDIAEELGRYVYAEKAVVLHDHKVLDSDSDSEVLWSRSSSETNQASFGIDRATYTRRLIERRAARQPKHRRVALAFPITDEKVSVDFMKSLLGMDLSTVSEMLFPEHRPSEGYRDIADVRTNMVRQALQNGCTDVIFMDTDQTYAPDTVTKLMAISSFIVGAPVHRRWKPFDVVLRRGTLESYTLVPKEEAYSGDVIKVDATGTGCLRIDTAVFRALGGNPFIIGRGSRGQTIGEDIGFCSRARTAGFEILIDTSIQVGHNRTFTIDRNFSHMYGLFCEWAAKQDTGATDAEA